MTLKSNSSFRTLGDSGLKTLAPELLDAELPSFGEVTEGRAFDELDPQNAETVRYACADSDYTLRLIICLTAGSIAICQSIGLSWNKSNRRPPCMLAL
jgi:hypothetical protein